MYLIDFGLDALSEDQLGDVSTDSAESQKPDWWGPLGLVARPPGNPDKSNPLQVGRIRFGSRDVVFSSRVDTPPVSLGKGETLLFALGSDGKFGGHVHLKADGGIVIQAKGGASITLGATGITLSAGGQSLEVGPAGILLGTGASIPVLLAPPPGAPSTMVKGI